MIMRKFILNIFIAIGLMSMFSLTSCYEDKGNYDYTTLDNVKIDSAGLGIQESYVVSRYDTLRLAPNVYFNNNLVGNQSDAPLDYVWTIYIATTGGNSDYTVDTLSTSRVLDVPITRQAGTYFVQLTITNRNDGIQKYFRVNCQVEESITAGWMLLYERSDKPGTSDVGLVVNPLVKKNIIKNKEFWNLYSASNGSPIIGSPLRCMHTVVSFSDDAVIFATDKDLVGVNQSTFYKILSFKDFFYTAPSKSSVSFFGVGGVAGSSELVINDNKIYTNTMMMKRNNFFGIAKTGEYGELAPWASDVHAMTLDAVVYDQTKGCFLFVARNMIKLSSFMPQGSTAPFDVNNVGMKLLMGDWGRNYYDYNLMQKDNKYFLTISNFNGMNVLASTNIGLGLYDVTSSPEIANATSMAVPFTGEFVLYGAGQKVYNLKYNSSTTAETLWTAPSADEKVTCVRFQKFYFRTLFMAMMPNANQILHIATYNEKTGVGKLYQYHINPASGAIMGDPLVYTVPGKVKDMSWKYVLER
jgi:hypothetical protein